MSAPLPAGYVPPARTSFDASAAVVRVLRDSASWPVPLRVFLLLLRLAVACGIVFGGATLLSSLELGPAGWIRAAWCFGSSILLGWLFLRSTRARFVDPFRGTKRGRPWGALFRARDDAFAARITEHARAVAAGRGLPSRDAWAEIEAFYLRWLNLPREAREWSREELRRDGIDMIRLGDALRR